MEEERWTPGPLQIFLPCGGEPYDLNICPGWVVRQPAVIQGAQAANAFEKSSLEAVFPGLENPVIEAALIVTRAFNLFEAEQMKNLAKKKPEPR